MASIFYRCIMCDANLNKPEPVEVAGDDPPVSACYQAVMQDHALKSPNCPAAHGSAFSVSVDFLVRLVQ